MALRELTECAVGRSFRAVTHFFCQPSREIPTFHFVLYMKSNSLDLIFRLLTLVVALASIPKSSSLSQRCQQGRAVEDHHAKKKNS